MQETQICKNLRDWITAATYRIRSGTAEGLPGHRALKGQLKGWSSVRCPIGVRARRVCTESREMTSKREAQTRAPPMEQSEPVLFLCPLQLSGTRPPSGGSSVFSKPLGHTGNCADPIKSGGF